MREIGARILAAKGFSHPAQEESWLFVYKELQVNRVSFYFSLKHTAGGISYSAKCTCISNELGAAINFISGKKYYVFPFSRLCSLYWREKLGTTDLMKAKLESNSTDALEYAQNMSFQDCLADILSTLKRPGSHQLWHIAALACTRDMDAIKELLFKLNTPDRGGLFPYISRNYLELALEYAEGNT